MRKTGPDHKMKIMCSVEDVRRFGCRRVEVLFQDNGCGMNRDVVENGLLRIGASASTRTDAGRKNKLSDAAGGFGLAKVLLYLCQSGFNIWTKMLDGRELQVSAEVARKDQELCTIQEALLGRENTFAGAGHGTKALILLDPWVMELQTMTSEVNEDFYTRHALLPHEFSSAKDYEKVFQSVWEKSNLPIAMTLNRKTMSLNADLGAFQVYILMPQSSRRFAALYAKPVKDSKQRMPPVKIVLQTLSSQGTSEHDLKRSAGYFLYLFEDKDVEFQSVTLEKTFEISVLLLSRDQHGREFSSGDLLKGTRDALNENVKSAVNRQVQAYIIDRYAVKPPVARQTWYEGSKNLSFTSWLSSPGRDRSQDTTSRAVSKTEKWWKDASQADADRHFGQTSWRSNMEYNFVVHIDPFLQDSSMPHEFKDVKHVKPETLMWMELFGVLVREILDVFQDEVARRKKSVTFEIGFYVGDHDFVRTVPMENGCPAYLFNQKYLHSLGCKFGTFSLEEVSNTLACVKNMAIRAVTYDLNGPLSPAAAFQLFEQNYLKFEQRASTNKWSWFKWYKERMEVRYLRELQDGSSAETLKRHIVAMQAPFPGDTSYELLQSERERLQAELDELRLEQESLKHEEEPEMPNPLTHSRIPHMDPRLIRYSQDSCSSRFRCGRSLARTTSDLRSGNISADINIPMIEVFQWRKGWRGLSDEWYTTGNRRLKCFKDAGLTSVPVKKILFENVWKERLSTKNNGIDLVVR
eukprot:TRINITY_DN26569_c0_g2_i1.p1 TRINITY_DN26569_c0_g2~~TRINITY_DN26569_c0_g2_i1.p1  ORF type:complete len:823 (-),score=77.00 TRINITY_DN26569_c0_g2_i1:168-2414(-)